MRPPLVPRRRSPPSWTPLKAGWGGRREWRWEACSSGRPTARWWRRTLPPAAPRPRPPACRRTWPPGKGRSSQNRKFTGISVISSYEDSSPSSMLEDCRRAEAAAASKMTASRSCDFTGISAISCYEMDILPPGVLDEEEHAEQVAKGRRKLSHKAFQGAIMIMLYRDEPRFHVPFRVLTAFMNIDERLAQWRYSHMMLVHRTLGAQCVPSPGHIAPSKKDPSRERAKRVEG
mmetsp:Transcript_39903/g.127599  ORF Transcript_39903/g.127599 Transcript_39903/m.127599 type:complete len:232 (-) Transcript_39903:211-906(-)